MEGLEKQLGHEGGDLMNGISVFIKETPREIPCSLCHMRGQGEARSLEEDPRQTMMTF